MTNLLEFELKLFFMPKIAQYKNRRVRVANELLLKMNENFGKNKFNDISQRLLG